MPTLPDVHTQAEILVQALPHMQRYDQEIVVIKYGGHAMGNADLGRAFARDIALLKQSGINPIVVHGGGPQIGAMLKRLGVESQFVNGLRVTTPEALDVAGIREVVTAFAEAARRAVGAAVSWDDLDIEVIGMKTLPPAEHVALDQVLSEELAAGRDDEAVLAFLHHHAARAGDGLVEFGAVAEVAVDAALMGAAEQHDGRIVSDQW